MGALLIGQMAEACTVILLFAVGEALEGYTAEKARNSLQSLLALKPEQAHVMRPCIDCSEHMGVMVTLAVLARCVVRMSLQSLSTKSWLARR